MANQFYERVMKLWERIEHSGPSVTASARLDERSYFGFLPDNSMLEFYDNPQQPQFNGFMLTLRRGRDCVFIYAQPELHDNGAAQRVHQLRGKIDRYLRSHDV